MARSGARTWVPPRSAGGAATLTDEAAKKDGGEAPIRRADRPETRLSSVQRCSHFTQKLPFGSPRRRHVFFSSGHCGIAWPTRNHNIEIGRVYAAMNRLFWDGFDLSTRRILP